MSPTLRKLLILLIALIVICCTASALLSLKAGHTAKAVSTFCAGLAFSILIGSRLVRR
jgi:uncharacterized membrane protein